MSIPKVLKIRKEEGYSLPANAKTQEGRQNPDRDQQFQHTDAEILAFVQDNQQVISVDTKKKELVGKFKNAGRTWRPKGQPDRVNVHDFADKELGKAAPYGVYDVTHNEGWFNLGISHDTATFAVESIRRWWNELGRKRFPNAQRLLITADCGGSNGARVRLWKVELPKLAAELNLEIFVSHLPPGTSKWNKIEHRLFSFVSINWRGKPLRDMVTIINLNKATKTDAGLKVHFVLDQNHYEKGKSVTDTDIQSVKLVRNFFHGE